MFAIHVHDNLTELNQLLITHFMQLVIRNVESYDCFHLALSGGRTPQIFFKLLAKQVLPWNKIHIYLTDERYVPETHQDSNIRMIRNNLIQYIDIPKTNIHAIQTELISPEEVAIKYESELKKNLPKNVEHFPQFDFMLLGVGEDGHVASLFPNTNILTISDKIVAAVFVEKLNMWRISLTFSMINRTKHVAILLTDPNKSHVVKQIFLKNPMQPIYPVQMLRVEGQLDLFVNSVML